MITETKEIYKCEHCRKLYQIKRFAETHEKSCTKNPDNWRACHQCTHLGKRTTTIYYDTGYGGEQEEKLDLLYCSKLDTFIYPPSVEHKGNCHELGDDTNKPMPKECEDQKKHQLISDYNT